MSDSRKSRHGNKKQMSDSGKSRHGNKKQMNTMFIVVLTLVVVIAIAFIVIFGMKKKNDDLNSARADREAEMDAERNKEDHFGKEVPVEEEESEGYEDIVMFGVDSRDGQLEEGTRSDSLMIAHIDYDEKDIKIVSIYRDTMVEIDGHGCEKITHAHAYGGPTFARDTVNKNFDLEIEDYITVNFNSVGALVDKIGGVELDLNDEEVEVVNKTIDSENKKNGTNLSHLPGPGTYVLDGEQTVAYTRIRYAAGGDYRRAERQRTVLMKLFETAKKMSRDEKLETINYMLGNVKTSLNTMRIMDMLTAFSDYGIAETTAYPQIFYGGSVEGHWVEVPCTLIDMNASMHEYMYGDSEYVPSEAVTRISETLSAKVDGPNNDLTDAY